jgi:hypothetical protein
MLLSFTSRNSSEESCETKNGWKSLEFWVPGKKSEKNQIVWEYENTILGKADHGLRESLTLNDGSNYEIIGYIVIKQLNDFTAWEMK